MNIQDLPEDCIANIISFTTPRDACRLSMVSSTFKSIAKSDSIWEKFLPSECETIISESSSKISSSSFNSKKQFFGYLVQHPILIDEGKKSFQLDKIWGKKCYMLSARLLYIFWVNDPEYWNWTSLPEARFSEVPELVNTCWLEIEGEINTSILSPNTLYGAYFVFKTGPDEYQSVTVSIGVNGFESQWRDVHMDTERERERKHRSFPQLIIPGCGIFSRRCLVAEEVHDCAKQRDDGWFEIELGDYFKRGPQDFDLLTMKVWGSTRGRYWNSGFFIQGIEIRPKPIPWKIN